MNVFSKVLDEIKFTIPYEILQIAFQDNYNWRTAPISLDESIMNKVIKQRVLVDANLVGGIMTLISLDGLTPEYMDQRTLIYNIPMERTNYKTILSVLSVNYLPYQLSQGIGNNALAFTNSNRSSDLTTAAQRLENSFGSIPPISNAYVEIVGPNTILVRDEQRLTSGYLLRCILENDNNLSNLNIRSYHNFAHLCKLAVRSYIYNKLIIMLDQAYLSGGQEMSSIKGYIDNLADSEQMYQDYLNQVWGVTAFVNDVPTFTRFIKLMINPAL